VLAQLGSKLHGSRRSGTHLFACGWVSHQGQVNQVLESRQRIQVGELCDSVLRKDQCAQVRYARRKVWLNVGDAVLREEEGAETGL
jgi:hypothetical protein